jgi:hypothetical protein
MLSSKQKSILSLYYPELNELMDRKTSGDAVDALIVALIDKIQSVKGEDGYTPVKGKDYWTEKEVENMVNAILAEATPIKGVHYSDGENGKDYILTSKDKREIASVIEVPIVEKIVEKTEVIKEVMPKLDVSMVKNAVSKKDFEETSKKIDSGMARIDGRLKLVDQRWHGGGLSKVSHDSTLSGDGTPSSPLSAVPTGLMFLTATGAVNGSNQIFTFLSVPTYLVIDGAWYTKTDNNGVLQWSNVGLTITTQITPSNSIWGF